PARVAVSGQLNPKPFRPLPRDAGHERLGCVRPLTDRPRKCFQSERIRLTVNETDVNSLTMHRFRQETSMISDAANRRWQTGCQKADTHEGMLRLCSRSNLLIRSGSVTTASLCNVTVADTTTTTGEVGDGDYGRAAR